jgi:purine-binding chemotaxis protein CheW
MSAMVEANKENKEISTHSSDRSVRSSDVLIQLVTFNLVGEEFGLPILDVREIIRMVDVTPVPHSPDFVEGVINLRGQILPVIDLRKRFNLESSEADEDTRIVVVEINNNLIGLIVDGVNEVLRIPSDTVNAAPQIVSSGIGAEYIQGIAHYDEKMIILVDLERVFSSEEMDNLANIS